MNVNGSIRVQTMSGEIKFVGDVGPQGPQGAEGPQGPKGATNLIQSTITLLPNNWNNNSQTVSVPDVTDSVIVWVAPTPTSQKSYTDAGIICTEQGNGTLTFTCEMIPSEAITVNVAIGGMKI